ncbi:hypothetical protein [Cochlodiniinecator piscidefendens]|uniref:hypothetical protein n=1 Tax=Cochlodiniinecator piscidefendens TaxID=2715756 RepID=UPI00140E88D5|nr:hypothetical protein [Cochlodiniinecator piscidefendens]
MKNLKSKPPEEVYVALQIAFYGSGELLEWVKSTSHLDAYAEDGEVAELICADANIDHDAGEIIQKYFRIVQRYWEDLVIPSDTTEQIAKRLLAERLAEYLSGECKPFEVCRVFQHIEVAFDYPAWLGDMYSACDWVEPETASSDHPYLAEIYTTLLPKLTREI